MSIRVVAKEKGHFGIYRQEGEEFDVPDDMPPEDFTWFEPVDPDIAASEKAAAKKKKGKEAETPLA